MTDTIQNWLQDNQERLFLCEICNIPRGINHTHFKTIHSLMWLLDQRELSTTQNNPYSLYTAPKDFKECCEEEGENDIRHLGRWLWFEYFCKNCGTKYVLLSPDYPYCGANSTWTCDSCAAVMQLCDINPIAGKPKKCTITQIRSSN